ncbi:hypothetical protein BOC59_27535 [Burkholderia pseudomallei]|nr:hypothetical protein [Burkholderia pseudomallei]ARM03594.1 hypothetical protein BOC59_27535 [Burkholderia pseudomallei]
MSTITGRSSRRLFKQFSNVPNGVPVTESGRVVYSVEPLHAEILLAHRLAYRSQDPRSSGLHLYNDTFLSEVRAVLSRRPEDINLPDSFGR